MAVSTSSPTPSQPNAGDEQCTADSTRVLVEEDLHLAHSLRTPLTALKSALELLCQGDLPQDSQRFANMAQRNADRMIELVEQLLANSSIKS